MWNLVSHGQEFCSHSEEQWETVERFWVERGPCCIDELPWQFGW